MCEQYGDWQLFEKVHSTLSALRQDHNPIIDNNCNLSKPAGRSIRERLKGWLRSETKIALSADQPQTNDVTVQLIAELFDLLIQTRNNQRRLEREQTRLQDRLLSVRNDG
jgi:hypothetical protein